VLHQHLTTGARSRPDALAIDFYTIVPIAHGGTKSSNATDALKKEAAPEKERPRVPEGAREILRTKRHKDAGLAFAKLTGDFNPIHWLTPYARASGFPNVIQHGFASLALCWEALTQRLLAGDVHAMQSFDVKCVWMSQLRQRSTSRAVCSAVKPSSTSTFSASAVLAGRARAQRGLLEDAENRHGLVNRRP